MRIVPHKTHTQHFGMNPTQLSYRQTIKTEDPNVRGSYTGLGPQLAALVVPVIYSVFPPPGELFIQTAPALWD